MANPDSANWNSHAGRRVRCVSGADQNRLIAGISTTLPEWQHPCHLTHQVLVPIDAVPGTMRSQMANELTRKLDQIRAIQSERYEAASEAPWRLNSHIKQARLNSAALAWQAGAVGGSNPPCSTPIRELEFGSRWR